MKVDLKKYILLNGINFSINLSAVVTSSTFSVTSTFAKPWLFYPYLDVWSTYWTWPAIGIVYRNITPFRLWHLLGIFHHLTYPPKSQRINAKRIYKESRRHPCKIKQLVAFASTSKFSWHATFLQASWTGLWAGSRDNSAAVDSFGLSSGGGNFGSSGNGSNSHQKSTHLQPSNRGSKDPHKVKQAAM